MGTTNYENTFITVAPDCPVTAAVVPPERANPTVVARTHALISEHPYELTSDDVLFTVHADRNAIAEADRESARTEFFAADRACLRSSDLGKKYGWGVHSDARSRVALHALGSATYDALARGESPDGTGTAVTVRPAMRSSRAR